MMLIRQVLLVCIVIAEYWCILPHKDMGRTAKRQAPILKKSPVSVTKHFEILKASSREADVLEGVITSGIQNRSKASADFNKEIPKPVKLVVSIQPPVPVIPSIVTQRITPISFDADLNKRKDLSAYAKTPGPHSGMVINPQCISVVPDPIFGDRRLVMELNVTDNDVGPTSNPRAQVQTPMQYTQGQEVWAAFSVFFPEEFPDFLSWMTLAEFYGAPYSGTSPFLIGCQRKNIILQHNSQNRALWEETIKKELWYDIVYRTILSRDSSVGEVQVFMRIQGEGPAWREILQGNMATITESNAQGPQYHKICNYRSLKGNWQHLNKTGYVTATKIFLANHRLGATRKQVEPAYLKN